jgi:hypothetical protein
MESIMTFRTNRLIAERLRVEDLDELCHFLRRKTHENAYSQDRYGI